MNPPCASHIVHISYWEFFQKYFSPLIKEMDILLKSIDEPVPVKEAARVLTLTPESVEEIMAREGINEIDQEGFFRIAMYGDSSLCRMLQRECMCGTPEKYSPSHIAYIYGLQDKHVASVCREYGYNDDEITARDLPKLLSKIFIYITINE